jgi:hypothetical protein
MHAELAGSITPEDKFYAFTKEVLTSLKEKGVLSQREVAE